MKKYSKESLWIRVILFFVICTILIFCLQVFVLPLAENILNAGNEFPDTLAINIVRAMNGIVGIGLVYIFLSFDRQKMEIVGFKWNKDLGPEWMIIGIPIAILALVPTVIIEHFSGIITFGDLLGIFPIILTLFVTILAIGLGEEILFRGYLQTILETRYSFPVSALVSAFLFGLLHFLLWTPTGKIENMVAILFSAGVIGITFSYVFKTTKYNLILPVSIHGFWDFFLFIFQAEFEYTGFLEVVFEIFASIVGAIIIFILVYQYSLRRLKKISMV